MTKIKTYEVVVISRAKWIGTVEAKTRVTAERLAEEAFSDGVFRQIDDEILKVICEVRS